jgi:hypothetical protein
MRRSTASKPSPTCSLLKRVVLVYVQRIDSSY